MGFGERVKSLSKAKGLSLKDISKDLGVPYRTLMRYLSDDRDPKLHFANQISNYFGTSIEWLALGLGPKWLSEKVPEVSASGPKEAVIPISRHNPVDPPLSPDLARYLGLPEGASVAEAIKAIEVRAIVTSSRDESTDVVKAETEHLKDRLSRLESALARLIDTARAADAATHPKPDPDLLERLACVAATIFRDANVTLPPTSLTAEATIMFNDLVTRVSDVSDPDEIVAAMPLIEYNLKKRLKDATTDPGAGKRGA